MQAALTRQKSPTSPPWYPQQVLSLAKVLAAYINRPPAMIGKQDRLGRLQPGFLADLVVLSDDPFKIDPYEVGEISPLATMIAGEFSWMDDRFPTP
jgi:hypothetical protein